MLKNKVEIGSTCTICARVRAVRCHMIVLNFTQPEMGGKSTGIICTQGHRPTGQLHVDLEDCILAGYSVFTPGEEGKVVSYTTKGNVSVQSVSSRRIRTDQSLASSIV